MTIIHSLILGIVEGFTEYLPISSTAHIVLASKIIGLDQSAFLKTFEICIQGGAIFAVVAIYWRRFLDMDILKRVVVAFIPTGIIGLALYKVVKGYLIGSTSVILWALALGGMGLIVFEYVMKKRGSASPSADANENLDASSEIKALSYKRSALIGVAQAAAIIPGVSRSAATIVGGMLCGLSRRAVVEFSFLLAVPTILAATGLDFVENLRSFTSDQAGILAIGFLAAFLTAVISVRFLLAFIKNRTFTGFGVYRIIIAIIFTGLVFW